MFYEIIILIFLYLINNLNLLTRWMILSFVIALVLTREFDNVLAIFGFLMIVILLYLITTKKPLL